MKILVLAGEQSGENYAKEIISRFPGNVEVKTYSDYGFCVADLGVMGFWPVIKRLFFFLRVKRTMLRAIDEFKPEVVLTIDYPGMNIPLAAYAKKKGIRTVHVVSPQVWAWKKWKIPKIERTFDRLCCFFPFEVQYYKDNFAVFVGHPLVDSFSKLPHDSKRENLLALLPGSRVYEVQRHMPILIEALKKINIPGLKVVIPAANGRVRRTIEKLCAGLDVEIADGKARELLLEATCAVVASGTATLEAALARCPTVLVYKVGPITEFIARILITGTSYVGLANIIWDKCGGSGKQPMIELLQKDFSADKVSALVTALMEDPLARKNAVESLNEAMKLLQSDGNAIERIVKEVLS